jgi:multidrug efflux system membrane fusion protein
MPPALDKLRSETRNILQSPSKLALALFVLLLLWLFVVGEQKQSEDSAPEQTTLAANSVNRVQVKTLTAESWQQNLVLQGQILPWRRVTLQSEVAGRVTSILKGQGEAVRKGEALLTISDEGRQAQLNRAIADVEFNQIELESATELKKSKFVSAADLSRFKASLAEAQAKLESAQLEFDYGTPKAPFSGTIDRRHIEEGTQVSKGSALFDLVQIDKLRVSAFVPQQKVASLKLGQDVALELLDGTKLQGKLHFISAAADEQTRSYFIEVTIDNTAKQRIAGASVTLSIPIDVQASHRISPALLALDKEGRSGVYMVDEQNIVQYAPVNILSIGNEAIVSGLPETVRLITTGAGFVKTGQQVEVSELEG